MALLEAMSVYFGLEATRLYSFDEKLQDALGGLIRQHLRALAFVFQAFLAAWLTVRIEGLKDCDYDQPYLSTLLRSSPFYVKLLSEKAVQDSILHAKGLHRNVCELLKQCAKKKGVIPYKKRKERRVNLC